MKTPQALRRSLFPFAAALALSLPACDSQDGSGPDADRDEIVYELVDADYPLRDGEATICSIREAMIGDELDRREEQYFLERMNTELSEDADWQAFSGFEVVDSCEDAREYSQLRLEYEQDVLPAPGQPSELFPEEIEHDDDGNVDKIGEADGVVADEDDDIDAVVQIQAHSGGQWCSGTFINPRAILTAAHCIGIQGSRYVSVRRKDNGDVKPLAAQWANTYAHVSYTGAGDPGDDVGLVVFSQPFAGVDANADTMRVMTSAINVPDAITFYGWGRANHMGSGSGVLRWGDANVNWAAFQYFTDNVFTGGARICKGDSGGPATLHLSLNGLSHHLVGGMASEFSGGSAYCPYPGDYQRWSAPGHKIAWIEERLLMHGIDVTSSSSTACHRFSQSGRNYMRCW